VNQEINNVMTMMNDSYHFLRHRGAGGGGDAELEAAKMAAVAEERMAFAAREHEREAREREREQERIRERDLERQLRERDRELLATSNGQMFQQLQQVALSLAAANAHNRNGIDASHNLHATQIAMGGAGDRAAQKKLRRQQRKRRRKERRHQKRLKISGGLARGCGSRLEQPGGPGPRNDDAQHGAPLDSSERAGGQMSGRVQAPKRFLTHSDSSSSSSETDDSN
jgi:hypothetical protein